MSLTNYTPDQLQALLDMLVDSKVFRETRNKETFLQGVDYTFWTGEILKAQIKNERQNAYDSLPNTLLITTHELIKL